MNNQLILTKGLPGCGKSTWAKKWVAESPATRIRVNRDDLRNMFGPYWIPEREDFVTLIEAICVKEALDQGKDVVLDATNFKPQKWINLYKNTGVAVIIKDFTDVPLEVCIERDSKRTGTDRVGKEVIERFYTKYINGQKKQ